MMRSRSWRWLKVRLAGLVSADTRLGRSLADAEGKRTAGVDEQGNKSATFDD